jgi:hypothetical protein
MSVSLSVAGLPSNKLAYTNAVFISPKLASKLVIQQPYFVRLNDTLVYELRSV